MRTHHSFSFKHVHAAVFASAAVCFLLLGWSHIALAIGITPPQVDAESILRGTTQEKSFTIVKDSAEINTDFEYTTEVRSDYPGVIEITPSFEIPSGKQTLQVPFTIHAEDLANGSYSALIVFYQKRKDTDTATQGGTTASLQVVTGIAAKVLFTVSGDQTVGYELSNLQVQTTETDNPVHVTFSINNTGNVAWRPQKIQLKFDDQVDHTNSVAYTVNEDAVSFTGAGAQQDVGLDITPGLVAGEYRITADFYYGDAVVQTLVSQPFHVFPPDTLAQSGTLLTATTNKTSYDVGERVKLSADFENTGDIRVGASLVTEIYRDGSLLDLRKADALNIDAGETSTLSDIFSLDKPGSYELNVSVSYANKTTVTKTVDITVLQPQDWLSSPITQWLLIGAITAIILLIVGILLMRRRKKQKKIQQVQSETVDHIQKD